MIVSSNSPGSNRFIRKKEKDYIEEQTKETMEAFKESEKGAPWLKILSSKPAAAIFFGHSCSNWGTYLFLTSLPTYMKEILKFDVKSVNLFFPLLE
jgi:ACS family sodium-dependent inorganic phosphate cotransporter-like MFS transporter 5